MIAEHQRWAAAWRFLFAGFVCALLIGCQGSPAPPQNVPTAPVGDAQVLLVLDCYDPVYQLNADGRVIRLRMRDRNLPGPALAEIGKLTELIWLDLHGVNLTDDGLVHLKNLQKLRSLGLGGTPVTGQGLVHLEKMSSLQYLWYPKRTVAPEAIEKLKEARPDMKVYPQ